MRMMIGKSKCLHLFSEFMEGSLGELNDWTRKNRIGINPANTELMSLTNQTKLPIFKTPVLGGESLELYEFANVHL